MTVNELTGLSREEMHRRLVTEYGAYVRTIVHNRLRSCGNSHDIEECVCDVFAELFFAAEKGSISGDVRQFAAAVAKRRAVDKFRRITSRSGRNVPLEEAEDIADTVSVEQNAERSDIQARVMEAVKSLSEPDCSIILHRFYFGRTSRETAGILGMKATTVRTRTARAMEKLRSLLADFDS